MDIPMEETLKPTDDEINKKLTQTMLAIEQNNHSVRVSIKEADEDDHLHLGKSIDFVLVFVDNGNALHDEKRREFEDALKHQGLELEYEYNDNLCFIKIYSPQEVLCRYCEIMKLKMPIKLLSHQELDDSTFDLFNDARSLFMNLFTFAKLEPSLFPKKEASLLAEFSRDKDYLFDTENDNFFPTNTRTMVVDFILERQCEGIHRLLASGVYSAAYPLHDGPYKEPNCKRNLLYKEWGALKNSLKLQPLDTIQEYFGDSFAMYFAWLGYYTFMLIPASIFGLLCFFYGLLTSSSNSIAEKSCSPWANDVIMCPLCNRTCDYWRLNETCLLTKVTVLIDNPSMIAFAVFMSIWSVLYLELWRRKSEELSYRWGLGGWDQGAEHPRQQYLAMLSKSKFIKAKERLNSITMEKEPHVSFWKVRVPATMLSFTVVLLLIAIALGAVFGIVLYRMWMITSNSLLNRHFDNTQYKNFAVPSIAAAINLVCILALNYFYDWLAVRLTEMEMIRTQTEFDDSLTLKVYIFQFVNYYASIFYVAFLKGKFVGYPKKYNTIFGQRQEECSPGGCLMELFIQLVIIMVGKQAVYTAVEMIWPVLMKWWALFRIHTGIKRKDQTVYRNQWTRDFKLLDWGPRGLYDEYLEMVIQFGFITLFVVAFPLAPLFALLNNILEMRLDATKFLRHLRRPVPRRARDIGVWKQILDALARISVTTNAFIIAFSSNLIPRLVYISVNKNHTDEGLLDISLSYFNTSDFPENSKPINSTFGDVPMCRYLDYRNPPNHPDEPYKRPALYWHILAARFIFICVFQSAVSLINMAVQWCLAGIPRKLNDRIKREAYLTQQIIIKRESDRARLRSRVNALRRRSTNISQ